MVMFSAYELSIKNTDPKATRFRLRYYVNYETYFNVQRLIYQEINITKIG